MPGTIDEDLDLLHDGSVRFAENVLTTVLRGRIAATGSVLLRAGDDVTTSPNSQIAAGTTIDIYGDYTNGDTGYGTNMTLRGDITPGSLTASTTSFMFNGTALTRSTGSFVTDGFAGGMSIHVSGSNGFDGDYLIGTAAALTLTLTQTTGAVSATTASNVTLTGLYLTQLYGNSDADTFQFGDSSGLDPNNTKTAVDSPGYIHLGGKTRAYGGGNEDIFNVYYLQTMNVAAGHTLTLDGQAGSDTYSIYTLGSHGSDRNYVVNALDTGGQAEDVDVLQVFGYDNTAQSGYQGPNAP